MTKGNGSKGLRRLLSARNSVKRKTLQEQAPQVFHAVELHAIWQRSGLDVGFLLDEQPDKGREAWRLGTLLAESAYEIQASILEAIHGFYKQAMMSLRSALELAFLGFYYYDRQEEYVSSYIEGKTRTAKLGEVLESIFSRPPFQDFDLKFLLKQEILRIYNELSRFTYSRGSERQEIFIRYEVAGAGLRLEYNERAFDQWYVNFHTLSHIVNTSLVLKYPHALRLPHWTAIEALPENRLTQLKDVLELH